MSEEKQRIEYQITEVEILEHSLHHVNFKITPQTIFSYKIELQHNVNFDAKQLHVFSAIEIYDHIEKTTQIGRIVTVCIFVIVNLPELINKENNTFELSHSNKSLFNMIALSTTRGLIHGVFKGTPLHHAILPVFKIDEVKSWEGSKKEKAEDSV